MKKYCYLFIIVFSISSCRDSKNTKVDDLVTVNDKGAQEVKVDELSVEDVERLMNASVNPAQSYTAILVNDVEKPYYTNADTNQTVRFILTTKSENVSLYLYKEQIKSVKKDSTSYMKIKDFTLICQGDSCIEKTKKATRYKAIVKLIRKFESKDSTAEYMLNIFKQ
jgi:uncharacterized protein YcfL